MRVLVGAVPLGTEALGSWMNGGSIVLLLSLEAMGNAAVGMRYRTQMLLRTHWSVRWSTLFLIFD